MRYVESAVTWAQREIPAFAGMTWVGVGMTWVGVGMTGGDASRVRARELGNARARVSVVFCGILSYFVEFCRWRVGELMIVDWGLQIGELMIVD